jgi:hypothetical protein
MAMDDCGRRAVRAGRLCAGGLIVAGALGFAALAAALAAGAFDGTYVGQAALMSGNNGSICKTFSASMTVTNDHLSYVHGGGYAVFNTDVGADGSFSGSAPLKGTRFVEMLKGKVTGGTIDADVGNPNCSFHLLLKKSS